jgi:hypothetical protein
MMLMRMMRLHKEIAKSKSHEIALDAEAGGPSDLRRNTCD